jgi:hypothetical protein
MQKLLSWKTAMRPRSRRRNTSCRKRNPITSPSSDTRRARNPDRSRAAAYVVLAELLVRRGKWPELDDSLTEADASAADDRAVFLTAARVILRQKEELVHAELFARHYLEQEPEAGAPTISDGQTILANIVAERGRTAEGKSGFQQASRSGRPQSAVNNSGECDSGRPHHSLNTAVA